MNGRGMMIITSRTTVLLGVLRGCAPKSGFPPRSLSQTPGVFRVSSLGFRSFDVGRGLETLP